MIFLDSSILIEYTKEDRVDLLEEMLLRQLPLGYNSIVLTEYVYHFMGYHGGRSPRALQEARRIPDVFSEYNPLIMLALFQKITDKHPSAEEVLRLMTTYNMLSNDAIILAHCLTANISYLASYNSDFQEPSRNEGITLIDSVDALNSHFPVS
jgi:predicted nucleic acid-binding protein